MAPSTIIRASTDLDMHQPQRGQPAVVPAPLAADTSEAPTPPQRPGMPPPSQRYPHPIPAPRPPPSFPHRCLDEDPARGGRKGGGRQSRLTLRVLPARPHLTAHVVCVFVALCAWCCVFACVRVLSQTPLTLSNPMHYPSTRASRPAAVQFCNTCLGVTVRPVAESKDVNTSAVRCNQCRD